MKISKFSFVLLLGLLLSLSLFSVNNTAFAGTNDNFTESILPAPVPQSTQAPEPNALVLFLTGLGGMILHFAQRSFEKFKRFFDIFLAVLGLLIASPILLLAAILIKLESKGPVIYRQKRVGKDRKIFRIYKLRSMRLDAEKGTGAVWAKKDDPRATSLGRWLRKTHIDEIPQLINVLKGEMSIVGPRPERPEMIVDFISLIRDYDKRLQIKPGITGIAQVWHKYDETVADVKKKVKYDLLYIRKMSLWVDLRIMANTCAVMLIGKTVR
jgi:lipopolysaccharide/colanic/teichoic acid biosynthesis glycosyltransferase